MKTIRRYELRVKRDRIVKEGSPYNRQLKGPETAEEIARMLCEDLDHEVFLVFLLDAGYKIIGYVEAASGGVDSCPVDMRRVFREAIHKSASAIIVAHNHPSGRVRPSVSDMEITNRIQEIGKLVGIPLLDHVIVTDDNFFSFDAEGLLPRRS